MSHLMLEQHLASSDLRANTYVTADPTDLEFSRPRHPQEPNVSQVMSTCGLWENYWSTSQHSYILLGFPGSGSARLTRSLRSALLSEHGQDAWTEFPRQEETGPPLAVWGSRSGPLS